MPLDIGVGTTGLRRKFPPPKIPQILIEAASEGHFFGTRAASEGQFLDRSRVRGTVLGQEPRPKMTFLKLVF